MGIGQTTVYDVLKRFEDSGSFKRRNGSGHVSEKMKKCDRNKLVKDALSQKFSQRDLGYKYKISLSYVNKILRQFSVKCYKKEKTVHVSKKQLETQKIRIGRLYRMLGDINSPAIVMDDESYFSLKHSTLSGNNHYYATCKGDAPDDVKFSTQRKFEQRLLV